MLGTLIVIITIGSSALIAWGLSNVTIKIGKRPIMAARPEERLRAALDLIWHIAPLSTQSEAVRLERIHRIARRRCIQEDRPMVTAPEPLIRGPSAGGVMAWLLALIVLATLIVFAVAVWVMP